MAVIGMVIFNQVSAQTNQNSGIAPMNVKIHVRDSTLHGVIVDTQAGRDFYALLPVRVHMHDLFGREKAGPLPKTISTSVKHTDRYIVGDIAYWSPNNDVAIYYHQDNEIIPSPGLVPLGHIDGSMTAFSGSGDIDVLIEAGK
jgi:hypothetical protein